MKDVSVFVTHDNGQYFDKAEKFLRGNGKIVPFIIGRKNIFNTDSLIREIQQIFNQMDPQDYLLFSGNGVVSSFVTALVYSEFRKVKILLWDNRDKDYVEEVLEFNK